MNDRKDTAMDKNYEEDDKIAFKKEGKDSISLTFFAAFIVILIIVSVIAFRSGVDVKQLQSDVAHFKNNLQNRYAKAGKKLSFDYKNVTAEGGILSKTIKIAEPSLTLGEGKQSYKISAASMHIVPDDAHYKKFSADLYAPVIIQNAQHRYVYKAEKPLPVDVTSSKKGMREYNISLPKSSIIDVSNGKGDISYTLDMQSDSSIEGTFSEEKIDLYMVNVDLNDVSLSNSDMKSTAAHFGYSLDIEDGVENEEINAQDVVSDYIPSELTPVSLDIAQQVTRDIENGTIAFNIQQFIADHASYNLDVEGEFTIIQKQLLPLADIDVELKGASYVLSSLNNSHVVPSSITNVVGSVLTKVAPSWNKTSEEPLAFKVQRTNDAPFMIGAVKADELFAIALKEWYINKNTIPFTPNDTVKADKEIPANGGKKPASRPIVKDGLLNSTADKTKDSKEKADIKLPSTVDSTKGVVSDTMDNAVDAVDDAASNVGDAVGSFFNKAKEVTTDAVSNASDAVSNSVDAIQNEASETVSPTVGKVPQDIEINAQTTGSSTATKIEKAQDILDNAQSNMNTKIEAAKEALPQNIEVAPRPVTPVQPKVQPKIIKVPAAE